MCATLRILYMCLPNFLLRQTFQSIHIKFFFSYIIWKILLNSSSLSVRSTVRILNAVFNLKILWKFLFTPQSKRSASTLQRLKQLENVFSRLTCKQLSLESCRESGSGRCRRGLRSQATAAGAATHSKCFCSKENMANLKFKLKNKTCSALGKCLNKICHKKRIVVAWVRLARTGERWGRTRRFPPLVNIKRCTLWGRSSSSSSSAIGATGRQ